MRSVSFLPLAIAVAVTIGVGAILRRPADFREPDRVPRPRKVTVKLTGKGSGPYLPRASGEAITGIRVAAWLRFEAFVDGRLISPERALWAFEFVGIDEVGGRWPISRFRSGKETFIAIESGNPLRPKELWIECSFASNRIGRWLCPELTSPTRVLSSASRKADLAADFPGLVVLPTVSEVKGSPYSYIDLRVAGDQRNGRTRTARIVSNSFNPSAGERVPTVYADKIDLVGVEVSEMTTSKEEARVLLQDAPVVDSNGYRRVRLPPRGPRPIAPGVKLVFHIVGTNLVAALRTDEGSSGHVTAIRREGNRVRSSGVTMVPPPTGDRLKGFAVIVTYTIQRTVKTRRYILKLVKGSPRAKGPIGFNMR